MSLKETWLANPANREIVLITMAEEIGTLQLEQDHLLSTMIVSGRQWRGIRERTIARVADQLGKATAYVPLVEADLTPLQKDAVAYWNKAYAQKWARIVINKPKTATAS